jgi:hypothetical protein
MCGKYVGCMTCLNDSRLHKRIVVGRAGWVDSPHSYAEVRLARTDGHIEMAYVVSSLPVSSSSPSCAQLMAFTHLRMQGSASLSNMSLKE